MKNYLLLVFGFAPLLFQAQDDSSLKKNTQIKTVTVTTTNSTTLLPLTSSKKEFVTKPVVQEQPSSDTIGILNSQKQISPEQ